MFTYYTSCKSQHVSTVRRRGLVGSFFLSGVRSHHKKPASLEAQRSFPLSPSWCYTESLCAYSVSRHKFPSWCPGVWELPSYNKDQKNCIYLHNSYVHPCDILKKKHNIRHSYLLPERHKQKGKRRQTSQPNGHKTENTGITENEHEKTEKPFEIIIFSLAP